jgi:hypothetical protein
MVICGPFQQSRGLVCIAPLPISLHMSQRPQCPQSPGPATSRVNACHHPPCCRLTLCVRVHSTVSPTTLLSCRLTHPSILPASPILAVLPTLIHPRSLTHPCLPHRRPRCLVHPFSIALPPSLSSHVALTHLALSRPPSHAPLSLHSMHPCAHCICGYYMGR